MTSLGVLNRSTPAPEEGLGDSTVIVSSVTKRVKSLTIIAVKIDSEKI